MKRVLTIILSVTVWLALAAYLVFASQMCAREQGKIMLQRVDITVKDDGDLRVITPEAVRKILSDKGYGFGNIEAGKINTKQIKEYLESHAFVKHAKAYTDMAGVLTVEVEQRLPVMRVNTYNGYNFHVSNDGWIMPVQPGSTVYVPIVTGSFAMPFEQGFGGSLDNIEESFREADRKAKQQLTVELNKVDAQRKKLIREEQPEIKKYRQQLRKANKIRQKEEKERKTAEIEKRNKERRAVFNEEIKKLNRQSHELHQKERQRLVLQKKEEQKYLYLLKLINFVELISNSTFWDAQIVQINVRTPGASGGSLYWKEPEVELIPRVGRHIVVFGTLDDVEEKLDKLMTFYEKVLDHEGWDAYGTINLKYKGQVVCRR